MNYSFQDECYFQYIQKTCPALSLGELSSINKIIESTSWDDPNSSLDWNNIAVIALIEAEECADNLAARSLYLTTAFEALDNGIKLDDNPLCAAHLALINGMIGDTQEALNQAYLNFINTVNLADKNNLNIPAGLIYFPPDQERYSIKDNSIYQPTLEADNCYMQAVLLLSQVLCYSNLVFYNPIGLRFLQLAAQLFPNSTTIQLKLGISSLMCSQLEGLLYLHRARQLAPDCAIILQSLYLAYRDLNQIEAADYWLQDARTNKNNSNSPAWQWTKLDENSSLTYVPFQNSLTMAVEPSFRSIVTSVLIAEGNWFEKEMEFWRSWIKPGMTVIDVGANVGVYTFSAALQVGEQGRVLAVEPFSGCVRGLQETCRINQLSWVTICAGAASDRTGSAKLSLQSASELNEIVNAQAEMMPGTFEEVACFTLDSLIEQHNIKHVDFLKIDAEGHELQVLLGSKHILNEFAPIILYENIAGSQGSNLPVAEFLIDQGYQLFRYKPYIQELIPINSTEELPGNLNIIALPPSLINQV